MLTFNLVHTRFSRAKEFLLNIILVHVAGPDNSASVTCKALCPDASMLLQQLPNVLEILFLSSFVHLTQVTSFVICSWLLHVRLPWLKLAWAHR